MAGGRRQCCALSVLRHLWRVFEEQQEIHRSGKESREGQSCVDKARKGKARAQHIGASEDLWGLFCMNREAPSPSPEEE